MTVLIAPDSFKGTYTAREVADAVATGVESSGGTAIRLPVADGGEGTLDVLTVPLGLRPVTTPVPQPVGQPVPADVRTVRRRDRGHRDRRRLRDHHAARRPP